MQRTEQDRDTGIACLAELLREKRDIGIDDLILPCTLFDGIRRAECREVAAVRRGFDIERNILAAFFRRDIPVIGHSRDAALFLIPRDHALRRIIKIGRCGIIEQEVDAADGRLLARCLFDILKLRLIIHKVIDRESLRFLRIFIVVICFGGR